MPEGGIAGCGWRSPTDLPGAREAVWSSLATHLPSRTADGFRSYCRLHGVDSLVEQVHRDLHPDLSLTETETLVLSFGAALCRR